jgi:hypothetical protein
MGFNLKQWREKSRENPEGGDFSDPSRALEARLLRIVFYLPE